MNQVTGALLVFFALLWTSFLGTMVFADKYSPRDVRTQCQRHGGVAQVVQRGVVSSREAALVICHDGHLGKVKR